MPDEPFNLLQLIETERLLKDDIEGLRRVMARKAPEGASQSEGEKKQ
jgi:hypothetical protein